MPRDDGYDPNKHFSPKAQEQLNREEIEELINKSAQNAVQKAFKEIGLDNPYEQPAVDPGAPRAYTSDEVTDQFLENVVHRIHYWQTHPSCGTMEERVEGVVHSLFAILDGRTLPLPAFDLVPSPHESDKQYHTDQGENYYDPKSVISTSLTELLYPTMRRLYPESVPSSKGQLTPSEMREQFVQAAYDVAWKTSLHVSNKRDACEGTAYQIMQLLDGEHPDYDHMPPFMVFAAPSKEFNQSLQKDDMLAWDNSIPLNRKPPYGVTDSLVDAYQTVRNRHHQAARDMFDK